jgi:hypothetical protein
MKIFCDIDSTINNHWVRIQRNTTIGKNGSVDLSDKAFTREEMMQDEPLAGSKDAIKRLKEEHEIHFLTARGAIKDGFNITKDWLNYHDFEYDSLVLVERTMQKVEFMSSHRGSLLIDDLSRMQHIGASYIHLYGDVIKELEKNNINFILFKGSWGDVLDKIHGVKK